MIRKCVCSVLYNYYSSDNKQLVDSSVEGTHTYTIHTPTPRDRPTPRARHGGGATAGEAQSAPTAGTGTRLSGGAAACVRHIYHTYVYSEKSRPVCGERTNEEDVETGCILELTGYDPTDPSQTTQFSQRSQPGYSNAFI